MSRLPANRLIAPAITVALALSVVGCGQSATNAATPGTEPAVATTSVPQGPSPTSPSSPAVATTNAAGRYVFPVAGTASYARSHHDYPAADIMAPCGAKAVSPVDGTVLEVTRVDTYDRKVNAGVTRGGLSISILGQDGARYYGSHYSAITAGIEPSVAVIAGQQIALVGKTGDAGACHVHFGLSPACTRTGDWWIRRGVIWPWPYLDAWRVGAAKSPMAEVTAWQASHGCPTKPLVDP
jgi:murein DD-endopeptidase MepM/ murein hydrolase activator NlpD